MKRKKRVMEQRIIETERLVLREMNMDDVNEITKVFMISREEWIKM